MTRSESSATGARISRILVGIAFLAACKLALIGAAGYHLGLPDRLSLALPAWAASPAPSAPQPKAAPEAPDTAAAKSSKANLAAKDNSQAQQQAPPVTAPDPDGLKAREEELNRREDSLKALERDLDTRLTRLQALETSIKKMLEDAANVKDQKLQHLVEVYTNMKAKQAAQVLETLDPEVAVKILSMMKGRTAGEILSSVEPVKAARLTEALTRLQASAP